MSESVLDHGYVPEEHAPDPVIGHGDPTPPGKIAIWMFLASEVMFFIAILGTYIILRSGSPELFRKFAGVLSKPIGALNTFILILSSLTMALAVDASQKGKREKTIAMLGATFFLAALFLGIKLKFEYGDKWHHHTVVYRLPANSMDKAATDRFFVMDGHAVADKTNDKTLTLHGRQMEMPTHGRFDIHLVGEEDIEHGSVTDAPPTAEHAEAPEGEVEIDRKLIAQDINYMPWKNIFYACYFTLTGVHGVHILGGMVPLFLLMAQAIRGKLYPAQTEYIGLYWHFVDLVWIFLFPLLYLI